ncbi:MAG: SxtJ family membrane protein [Verrucomicrobiota bacterium]
MTRINWNPSPRSLRHWALTMLVATALAGCILEFLLGHSVPARIVWGIGAVTFATGITGTKIARPFYLAWMGFVWVVSWILGTIALAAVFYLVVTPIGVVARLLGRDCLKLRRPAPGSLWETVPAPRKDGFDRTF